MKDSPPVTQTFLVLPSDANSHGTLFGGRLLAAIDMTAGICAMRRAKGTVVTASMDRIDFKMPVFVGDTVTVKAEIAKEGRTSMELRVKACGYNRSGEEIGTICSANVTMVSVDDDGVPRPLP
jgi:acyl-CoA hydrolase